jgi:hypothetical protein
MLVQGRIRASKAGKLSTLMDADCITQLQSKWRLGGTTGGVGRPLPLNSACGGGKRGVPEIHALITKWATSQASQQQQLPMLTMSLNT